MRIFMITQWFPPEHVAAGHMVLELAADLVRAGHEVTVVTGFPNHPSGVVFKGYRKRLLQEEYLNGVRVWRVYSITSPSRNLLNRMLTSLSFALMASCAILLKGRCDVMFSILQPLSIGVFVPFLSRAKRARLVFNLQDLHPDALVDLGLVTNKAVLRVLRLIESFSYRSADRVTVICDHFKKHVVSKGVRPKKVEVIENWVNLDEIAPGNRINDFRTRMGLSDGDYVVVYAGTIGFVSGVEVVLQAADKLRGQTDIKFLFVGDGPLVGKLKRRSEELSLDNTIFAPFQDKNILNDVQATADVSLVTMRKGKGNFSVPSKVLSYMAAARPVIASVDAETETAKQIRTAECGIIVPAGDSDAIAYAILDLHKSDELRSRLGMNGRKYLEENLNRNTVLEKYRKLFEDIGGA